MCFTGYSDLWNETFTLPVPVQCFEITLLPVYQATEKKFFCPRTLAIIDGSSETMHLHRLGQAQKLHTGTDDPVLPYSSCAVLQSDCRAGIPPPHVDLEKQIHVIDIFQTVSCTKLQNELLIRLTNQRSSAAISLATNVSRRVAFRHYSRPCSNGMLHTTIHYRLGERSKCSSASH